MGVGAYGCWWRETKREQLAWQRFGAPSEIITAWRGSAVAPNATVAYISPAYEMSDIRANFDRLTGRMQAFHHGGGVRFYRFGISSINPPSTWHRGLQSIAMRSKTILTRFYLQTKAGANFPEFRPKSQARVFRDSAATQSEIDCLQSVKRFNCDCPGNRNACTFSKRAKSEYVRRVQSSSRSRIFASIPRDMKF